jgi:hypothetical protein
VDRDGDGYISADDIFALQAMLMQRSEIFLRVSRCACVLCALLLQLVVSRFAWTTARGDLA